ncbi:uncharacterized protein LOC133556804 isoform X2 [Nerophis ophidion]|uniref:uncharacterized protein LOC133556804 isoform X2 n=1 Tax=Nerophis ophidion TaxID=159077 RepID=UPI002AE00F63|nr:uncharacterized protein LOC133556804 isoform X2 [Nerophis ophidion]
MVTKGSLVSSRLKKGSRYNKSHLSVCVYVVCVCVCVAMTGATGTKLLILMILIFIICLPQLFAFNRVSKATLVCSPRALCERDFRLKKRESGSRLADVIQNRSHDPPHIRVDEKRCLERDGNRTSEPWMVEDTHASWYMCETQGNVDHLHSDVVIRMSVQLQLGEFLKLTLYGHSNTTSLHLHPPEKEGKIRDDEGHREASYCCLSAPPTSEMTNHTACLFRLSNHTISIARAKEKFLQAQKDRWSGVFRVLWLILLCVVLLTWTSALLRHISRKGGCCYGRKDTDINTLKGRPHRTFDPGFRWTGLSPIEEVEADDEVVESAVDENVDHCNATANLHQRPTVGFPHVGVEPLMSDQPGLNFSNKNTFQPRPARQSERNKKQDTDKE